MATHAPKIICLHQNMQMGSANNQDFLLSLHPGTGGLKIC